MTTAASAAAHGTCRYCGCHGESCSLPNGDKCSWGNGDCTVCNAPGCMRAELARVRAAVASRPRSKYAGWGYGAIVDDLRLDDLRKRQRRRRRKGGAK
jgi:hypothetical protein